MKHCPQCNRTYADESLSFCLADGALLSAPYASETQVIRSAVNPGPGVIDSSIHQPPGQATQRPPYLIPVVVVAIIALLLVGSALAVLYDRSTSTANSNDRVLSPAPAADSRGEERTPTQSTPPTATNTPPVTNTQGRYSVTPCQSIKDARTGLEWVVGPDRNMTWYEAEQWTSALASCTGGWRMPSIEEIRGLFDPAVTAGIGFLLNGRRYPAHIDPVFSGIGEGSWVWANERSGDSARSFNLNQGIAVTYSVANTTYSTRAFAVRIARN